MLAFGLTIFMFLQLRAGDYVPIVAPLYSWASIGAQSFDVAFLFDRLSAVMTLVVTGVGSVIHVYSAGYMHDDKSFGRFFAYLNLFLFFMLLLVLGRSMLVLFVGWEGVGLASYLLIGFWFLMQVVNLGQVAHVKTGGVAYLAHVAGFLFGVVAARLFVDPRNLALRRSPFDE